ncbi:MAG: PDZ domain-containing protein, partial [Planctomycetota bacterium]
KVRVLTLLLGLGAIGGAARADELENFDFSISRALEDANRAFRSQVVNLFDARALGIGRTVDCLITQRNHDLEAELRDRDRRIVELESQLEALREETAELARPSDAFLGVDHRSAGAELVRVLEGSPAEAAGLLAGDVIVAIDEEGVTSEGLDRMLSSYEVGSPIDVSVLRDGSFIDFTLELGDRISWARWNEARERDDASEVYGGAAIAPAVARVEESELDDTSANEEEIGFGPASADADYYGTEDAESRPSTFSAESTDSTDSTDSIFDEYESFEESTAPDYSTEAEATDTPSFGDVYGPRVEPEFEESSLGSFAAPNEEDLYTEEGGTDDDAEELYPEAFDGPSTADPAGFSLIEGSTTDESTEVDDDGGLYYNPFAEDTETDDDSKSTSSSSYFEEFNAGEADDNSSAGPFEEALPVENGTTIDANNRDIDLIAPAKTDESLAGTQDFFEELMASIAQARLTRPTGNDLGVEVEAVDGGLEVTSVEANSPAEREGLEVGDLVTNVSGQDVVLPEDLSQVVKDSEGTISLIFVRDAIAREIESMFVGAASWVESNYDASVDTN